ncbi:MAG: response regulator [Kangiellaceae bacterium]
MFTLAKKHTLIIDDFTEFARSVRTMLYSLGNESVEIVNNADDAIEACKLKNYDIILSDYNLGECKDGQQLLEELMFYNILPIKCIFIMLTAENTSAMVMGAIEYQPDNYIAKPFTPALLKSRITKAVEKKETLSPINQCIKKNKWDEAVHQCRTIANKYPKYRMSCLRLEFKCLKKQNKLDQALALSLKIIADREIPWALQGVGEIYFLQKKFDQANSVFKNMIKSFPMNLEAYDWHAKTLLAIDQKIEAQEVVNLAIRKAPKVVRRQKTLGSIAEENKDFNTMTFAYRHAVNEGKYSAFASPDEYVKLTHGLKNKAKQENAALEPLISEAEETFTKLENRFKNDTGTLIRSNVAHAAFSKAVNESENVTKYSEKAKLMFDNFDGALTPQVCLEISKSLREIEEDEFADAIVQEAIQQNLDDKSFIEQIANFTEDQSLIDKCKKVAQQNEKGILHFKRGEFLTAIDYFEKANSISPKNINITLNYVQSLLKLSQSEDNFKVSFNPIELANQKLSNINTIESTDSRFPRYSELNRLTQLMISKSA